MKTEVNFMNFSVIVKRLLGAKKRAKNREKIAFYAEY